MLVKAFDGHRIHLPSCNNLFRSFAMSRRSHSASPGPRDAKRPRLDYLTPDDYRNGVMLAPMVRSGARTSAVHRAVRLDELTH